MSPKERVPSTYQRNALAPSLVAAAILFLAPALFQANWAPLVLFIASIFGLIVGWFALQARHWWWIPVFLAIAVLWNPVMPFPSPVSCGPQHSPSRPWSSWQRVATIKVIRK
ncbi:DUF6804 family protein [Microbacterium sp. NRRL B-14842]|uniref:DUF6804 family protein n=1 Tax=Microbacterium sp. NRRL B-14842 TaxID=3162881 RepID=UPI003D2DF950